MPQGSSERKRTPVVVWVLAAIAGVSMLAGAVLALQTLSPTGPARKTEGPEPVSYSGRKKPADFGLPACSGAFEFFSTESKPGGEYVSASFSVKQGTKEEIAAFYRDRLPKDGWQFQSQRAETSRPGYPTIPNAKQLNGLRQRWHSRGGGRLLFVVVYDDPQKSRTAQVLLSRSPLPKD